MKSRENILELTNGMGVTELVEIPRSHPVWKAGDQPLGSTSDDWALTGATARALTLIGKAAPRSPENRQAVLISRERQIALLQTGGAGWGPGTVKGTQEIGRWLDGHADGRPPWVEVPSVESTEIGKGAGCGPAMQISPLGLLDGLSDGTDWFNLVRWCRLMAFMTYGNIEASIAAHAMALATSYALRMGMEDLHGNFTGENALRRIVEILSEQYDRSSRVIYALQLITKPGFLDDPNRLREEVKPGFLCWESVPFAIGTWLRHLDDPRGAILEAASAGGDTDSTAAMAGALAGTYAGVESIPREWIEQVSNARVAIEHADRLLDSLDVTDSLDC
jgi:ADP-ribosylglycohydrolase